MFRPGITRLWPVKSVHPACCCTVSLVGVPAMSFHLPLVWHQCLEQLISVSQHFQKRRM
uniref:Uncharacterized protein n=1 Tax=Octopus bimaculoides TaxID=37653 RepID=A0A0L8I300_OCTBM